MDDRDSGQTVGRRTRQFAVVSLFVGLLSLRATLADPFEPGPYTPCQGWQYQKVTWRPDLTLELTARGCPVPADNARVVFVVVTACGAITTLYGAVILFRHGLPGMDQ